MQYDRNETPDEIQAMAGQQPRCLFGLLRQEAVGTGLDSSQAEPLRLAEDPLGLHLVAPSRHLTHAPRDGRPCDARLRHYPTSDGETGRCSASERSAAIAILSASSASVAVQGLSVSPLTREKKCSISALYASRKRSWKFG